ncbi:MAG: SRPBCC domain-containing protein [Dehalococcoidia bacterium]|nr:SRPBCC domain-containing protein [Dehalococcoidia bacterium]
MDITRRADGIGIKRRLRRAPSSVFAAFANPETLARWWGPPECPIIDSSIEFRPGGIWHYHLRSVHSGAEAWSRAVFEEIVPDRRIVFIETSSDAAGTITPDRAPAHTTIEFVPEGAGTLLVIDVRHVSEAEALRALDRGVVLGFMRALDQLEVLLTQEEEAVQ